MKRNKTIKLNANYKIILRLDNTNSNHNHNTFVSLISNDNSIICGTSFNDNSNR